MPLQHTYLVTKRIHCHCNISIWLLREYITLQYMQHIYLVAIIWLLREYMPLQHIYLVTKRIHAIATYVFGY